MRALQLRTLDVAFLHLGQSRMVTSTSPCKRAIFNQVMGRDQQRMATSYCCAQFLVRQDVLLAPEALWQRALAAMDEPLPDGCEHVRHGSGMHCLVFESIWHVMFGYPEAFLPRSEDITLPIFLRIPEADESDLPDGARSTRDSRCKCEKKTHPRKEVQDLFKFLKTMNKQATKRTGQFLKQLEKKEGKEGKRETLLKQVKDVDELMNEDRSGLAS
ncbi:unnamed protein product [Effrenium voratum]|uniref:Uncharacterized protein n=1 Tax=Effrenium voratum TaxID=2562239 RepID=A0AA36N136_9DINO|nr:unnamed protein product [Effrenium voratum]